RGDQIREKDEAPAAKLRAVAEIQILGQRVVLPSAGISNRGTAPDARGSVEIKESPRSISSSMLEDEMAVEENRLNLGQQRVVLIDMPPARLHHADFLVSKLRHDSLQEV